MPRFKGNSYANLGTPAALQIPTKAPFTIEAWVRVEAQSGTAMVYSKNSGRTTPYTYMFGLRSNGTVMSAYTGAGGSPVNTWRDAALPAAAAPGAWHHLAFSYDGTNLAFIYDGVHLGSSAYSYGNYDAHNVKIGGYANEVDLQGNIADLRVWDHARDATRIQAHRFRRLTEAEPGLLGCWPLDEGAGTEVFDQTANASTGTTVNVTWADAAGLTLLDFAVADPATGSSRFTNTNEVEVTGLSITEGCDHYQFTLSGDPASVNPAGWIGTNTAPGSLSFAWPVTDTNIVIYAWFTNTLTGSILHRDDCSIFYTTVDPVPSVRPSLTREQYSGQPVVFTASDIDFGSTGGVANGATLDILARAAFAADPGDDLSPGEPYVTVAGPGTYPLLLWLQNEAGNAITATATCLVTVVSYGGTNLWTGNGASDLWHDAANWSAGVPVAGQDVAIRGGSGARLANATAELASFALTGGTLFFSDWGSRLNATNATVSGGTITCARDFDDFGPSNRVWIACTKDFTLASPGKIDVNGKGYTSESGPGKGVTTAHGTGGGHGGQGGFGYKRGGGTYGSLTAPVTPGSGGTPNGADPGGSGGGAVRIMAGDTVTINGVVSANGLTPPKSAGGGAGGSIYITAAYFTGNSDGLLSANGAAAQNTGLGGGGGGGRIALDGGGVNAPLAVRFSTAPGRGDNDAFDASIPLAIRHLESHQAWTAGWGTLYIEDETLLSSMPQNNQFDRVVLRVGTATVWNVPQLTLTNNSFRLIPEGFQLNVTGNLTVGSQAHLGVEGAITCGGDLVLTNGARLSVYSGPTNGNGSAFGTVVEVANDIVIAEGSWLQPNTRPMNGGSVRLRMRNLKIIGVTAGINAMARGFAPRQGPGMGGGTGYYGGGGGYGGKGAKTSFGVEGKTYGNPYAPLAAGSGGGGSYDGAPLFTGSGYGGGLVSIEAAGDVMMNGQIQAGGGLGTSHYLYGAGGAGGGIFISCDRFTGTGTALLSVKGGNSASGGGGGGGRIAVWHKRLPSYLQAKLLAGTTGSAIASTNAPVSYLGQIDIGIGTGGTIAAQPGTIWFITPPPQGMRLILR